jgi:hypothetical protein
MACIVRFGNRHPSTKQSPSPSLSSLLLFFVVSSSLSLALPPNGKSTPSMSRKIMSTSSGIFVCLSRRPRFSNNIYTKVLMRLCYRLNFSKRYRDQTIMAIFRILFLPSFILPLISAQRREAEYAGTPPFLCPHSVFECNGDGIVISVLTK